MAVRYAAKHLDDFTVQMRELGLDPRNNNLAGVVGAALGPGHSFSGVMSALKGAAGKNNDVEGLFEALGRTVSPEEIMKTMKYATTTQDRFTVLLEMLNTKYGDNVARSNRLIGTSLGQINSFWSEFKEELVGTPQEGNLLWYIQQVFVDIKGWMGKNKATLMSFAHSIQRVLGGVGRMIYNLFQGIGSYSIKAIGGIQSAAEAFKKWSIRAEGTLSLWAIKIKNVFKEAGDEGLGMWDTMKKLWDEVFGTKANNVVGTFWEKFKTTGTSVLNWLGDKIAVIFGYHIQKGIVSVFQNSDGTLKKGTPDFVRSFATSVEAQDTIRNNSYSLDDIRAAKSRVADRKKGNPDAVLKETRKQASNWFFTNEVDPDNYSSKQVDDFYAAGYRESTSILGGNNLVISKKDAQKFMKKILLTEEIDRLLSKGSPTTPAVSGIQSGGVSGLGTRGLAPETVAVLGMVKSASGVSSLQTNSNVRTGGSGNHEHGKGTDIQATDELMRKFGVTKAMMNPANGKFNLLMDKGGVRVAYEPPEAGTKGTGHFHIDVDSKNSTSGPFNEAEARKRLNDITINVYTQATDTVGVAKEVGKVVKDVTGRDGVNTKKKVTAI